MAESDLDEALTCGNDVADDHRRAKALQTAAEQAGDVRKLVIGMIKAADAFIRQGSLPEASTQVLEAKQLCQEIGQSADDCLSAAGLSSAMIHLLRSNDVDIEELDAAYDEAADALVTFKLMDYKRGQASANALLCRIFCVQKEADRSIQSGKDALALLRDLGDASASAKVLLQLKQSHMLKQETAKAAQALRKARTLLQALSDRKGEAACLQELAEVHHSGRDWEAALEAADAANDLFRQLSDQKGQTSALQTSVKVHQELGNHIQAIEVMKQIVTLHHQANDKIAEARALTSLCEILLKIDEFDSVAKLAKTVRHISEANSDKEGIAAVGSLEARLKEEKAKANIEAAIMKYHDILHVPKNLVIEPGMNRRTQHAYAEFVEGLAIAS